MMIWERYYILIMFVIFGTIFIVISAVIQNLLSKEKKLKEEKKEKEKERNKFCSSCGKKEHYIPGDTGIIVCGHLIITTDYTMYDSAGLTSKN